MEWRIKNINILIVCTIVFFASSCGRCGFKKPQGVKPIDWENYNDVYTVYWNYCDQGEDVCKNEGFSGKTVMVYGWIFQGKYSGTFDPKMFSLIDNEINIFSNNPNGTGIYIKVFDNEVIDSLKIKFANTDITKKCYIKGELYLNCLPIGGSCVNSVEPCIIISNTDDIYFN